jgi:DNA-binding LacI/PurR family transcriptional regulator
MDGVSQSPGEPVERQPTLEAVAARAGVGRGTVSRVVNGSPKVSEAAREAVQRAIDELGYVPNRAARTLVTRRTDSIALVVSEAEERVLAEPYFAKIIRGVVAALAGTGLQLLLTFARTRHERIRLAQYLTGQHVDGVLLISLHGEDPLPAKLEAAGLPTVLGGVPVGLSPVSFVDIDNRGGARQAVDHLLGTGRRTIATIAGPLDLTAGVYRLEGYREAIEGAGVEVSEDLIGYGDAGESSGAAAMVGLLDRRADVDAVFAASDPMALGAMRIIKESGRRIPDDIAVVGFDDSPVGPHTDPPLTTVHQPVEQMGHQMTSLLLARLGGEYRGELSVVLPTRLIVRDSS